MAYVYATYMYYREGDGTITKDKYIRAIMEDGHDTMILAAPFFMLQDYLNAGGTIAPSPDPEPMPENIELARSAQAHAHPQLAAKKKAKK
jgi:hypothetical protein